MKNKSLGIGLAVVFACSMLLSGCGDDSTATKHSQSGNAVDNVLKEQVNANSTDGTTVPESASPSGNTDVLADESVDYDLASMGSDMVYATVYQMMSTPEQYVGKTVRMRGNYYTSYYEESGQRYFFCLIQDAAACCAQGIEFVWGDGSHVYPDEYPQEETPVEIKGIFETYMEGDQMYCHITNAELTTLQ